MFALVLFDFPSRVSITIDVVRGIPLYMGEALWAMTFKLLFNFIKMESMIGDYTGLYYVEMRSLVNWDLSRIGKMSKISIDPLQNLGSQNNDSPHWPKNYSQ